MIRTINNIVRTLLIHAHMPSHFWAEALAASTYLLNRRPSSAVGNGIPFELLHHKPPSYDHLRVFGCLCYPNLTATAPHKLAPRSTACVFLGYPSSHKGYRCLDITTRRVIISRHVIFDETVFPFAASSTPSSPSVEETFPEDDDMPLYTVAPAAAPSHLDVEPPPRSPLPAAGASGPGSPGAGAPGAGSSGAAAPTGGGDYSDCAQHRLLPLLAYSSTRRQERFSSRYS
jgi:histone deacetylase 1/2